MNGEALPVWGVSSWDEERKGFYHELFFELWLFDEASGVFQYHNRFVGIWLNVTR